MFNNILPIPPKTKPPLKKFTTSNKPKTTSTQKRATFTYMGKETTYITNLFKNTGLKVAMRTNNSIQNILINNKKLTNNTDKYTQSGVYKLSCPDCNKAYVGLTGIHFLTRFDEHKAGLRTNSQNSNYVNTVSSTHTPLNPSKTLCRYYNGRTKELTSMPLNDSTFTQSLLKSNHLNEEHTISPNKILEALLIPGQP